MKLLVAFVLTCYCLFLLTEEVNSIQASASDDQLLGYQARLEQRSRFRWGDWQNSFESRSIQKLIQELAVLDDFRNRKPDMIDVQPCYNGPKCVHGSCSKITFQWDDYIEKYPHDCICDDGYSGETCEIKDSQSTKTPEDE